MKNEIYEADYTAERKPDEPNPVFDAAVKSGFFAKYNQMMRSIPKVIVQKDKENYEELLPKLDALAKKWHGKIRGIVDYEHWDSHIYLTLPFFEFSSDEEHLLLKELNEKAHSLTFSVEGGMIRLSILINYFEEIGDTEEVFDRALEESGELLEVLQMVSEQRTEQLLSHPMFGPILMQAASNAGLAPEAYIDRCLADLDEDPEDQFRILSELLEAKDEVSEE